MTTERRATRVLGCSWLSPACSPFNVRRQMSTAVVLAFDPGIHRNHMPEIDAPGQPTHVLVVSVGRFQLEFLSRLQLEAAIGHLESNTGSTRMHAVGGDHWEFQPWQSRFPAGINNAHNRPKILTALKAARQTATALP